MTIPSRSPCDTLSLPSPLLKLLHREHLASKAKSTARFTHQISLLPTFAPLPARFPTVHHPFANLLEDVSIDAQICGSGRGRQHGGLEEILKL